MSVEPAETRPRRPRRLRRIILILVAALIPRLFVELHHVEGTSMWPSFNEDGSGEWLLVLKSWVDHEPRIWDPIVVTDPDDADRLVLKRVCALPGSLPRIEDGDLRLLEGKSGREVFVPRSLEQIERSLVPVTRLGDLRFRKQGKGGEILDDHHRVFIVPRRGRAALSADGHHLLIEAEPEGGAQLRLPAGDFMDDHRNAQGRMTAGDHVVRDLALTFSFAEPGALIPGTRVEFRHVIETAGDNESLTIKVTETGLELTTRGRGDQDEVLHLPSDRDQVIRWLLVDGHRALLVSPDGREGTFALSGKDCRRDLVPGSQRSYLNIDVAGSSVVFSRLDIDRDLHYTPALEGAGPGVTDLIDPGLERLLLLGDNSPVSRDSRFWRRDVAIEPLGRPFLAVWPWSRIRLLD